VTGQIHGVDGVMARQGLVIEQRIVQIAALTAQVDLGGRVIGLSTASILGPSLTAPAVAGRLYERSGFGSNLLMGLISVLAGLILYAWLLGLARRSQTSPH
jgi:hypothetical protein